MGDGGEFAVHRLRRADDVAAEGLADGLVTEADAEERGVLGAADDFEADAGVVRIARAGGDDDAGGFAGEEFIHRNFIVAEDFDFVTEIAEILDQVPGKAIVIVDEREHSFYVAGLPGMARKL